MAVKIGIKGVVQGVGFRPTVYRLATESGMSGWVRNLSDGQVEIVLNCGPGEAERFLELLRKQKPQNAKIEEVSVSRSRIPKSTGFAILGSAKGTGKNTGVNVPPDTAICGECTAELFDGGDRRFGYAMNGCMLCGPRFTIIESFPYDRKRTTMGDFPLCPECGRDYTDPANRRYHAETTCCPKCGPNVRLLDRNLSVIKADDPIREAATLLKKKGKIVAIKGIGGFHLAVLASSDAAVLELRKKRGKPQQPFAVMAPDLKCAESFATVGKTGRELLESRERPIVLLEKNKNYWLSKYVGPGLDTIGAMLPYTGIHHMLFSRLGDEPLVLTSANVHGEPMIIEESKLKGIADYFLVHERRIVNRCDDSVIRDGIFLRRARGFVPLPVELGFESKKVAIGYGAELNATVCVVSGGKAYVSQHIGDTSHLSTFKFLRGSASQFCRMLQVKPEISASDLNPVFPSGSLGKIRVQHHFAHAASLLAENKLGKIVAITADGFGYGPVGEAWGGEILVADYKSFSRAGHLREVGMPGGDLASYYPARMLASFLSELFEGAELDKYCQKYAAIGLPKGMKEAKVVLNQLKSRVASPPCSSAGRFLDAVAALTGCCYYRSYEGEPAMKLEALAFRGTQKKLKLEPDDGVLDTPRIIEQLLGLPKKDAAATAQSALAGGLAEIAIEAARKAGLKVVGFTGGVACNLAISKTIRKKVEAAKIEFVTNRQVPPGDGGVSLGQAAIAAHSV